MKQGWNAHIMLPSISHGRPNKVTSKFLSSLQIHGCDFYQNTNTDTTTTNRVNGTVFVYSNIIFFSFHERWKNNHIKEKAVLADILLVNIR